MFGQHPPGKKAQFSVSRVSAQVYPKGKKKTLENDTDLESLKTRLTWRSST